MRIYYPGTDDLNSKNGGTKKLEYPVVVDGNITRGPDTAYLFSLAIINALFDQAKADKVASGALVK